jgi:hypothetical protein
MTTVRRSRRWPIGAVLVAVAALAGCGGAGRQGEVEGTIKLNGQPVANGTVRFVSADGKETSAVIRNGSYRVEKVPVGEARLTVVGPKPPAGLVGDKQPPPPAIPDRYSRPDESGLTWHVTAGPQKFDIDLKP